MPRDVKRGSAPTLLVAIGDSALRDKLERSLRADGYQTYSAADGEAVLLIAGEHPLSLVLLALDLTHPLRDGLEGLSSATHAAENGVRPYSHARHPQR